MLNGVSLGHPLPPILTNACQGLPLSALIHLIEILLSVYEGHKDTGEGLLVALMNSMKLVILLR